MATTTTVPDNAESTAAKWSYGLGDDALENSMDFSARFIPILQDQVPAEESKVGMPEEQEIQEALSCSPAIPIKNRRQSMELNQVFPMLSEEEPPAVWSFGVGDDDASICDNSMNLSARFIPMLHYRAPRSLSNLSIDDEEEVTEQDQKLFSISSSTRPPNRRSSVELVPGNRRQSIDLSQVFPSLNCEAQPQGVTIVEEETTSEHEDIDIPLASSNPPVTPQKKRSSYSDSWDDMQLTPSDLLSKLMPNKVKDAEALISAKKRFSDPRTDCRSLLQESLFKVDSFDAESKIQTPSDCLHDEEPTAEDIHKWGVDGLLQDLKEGTKKKKKRKSTTKKAEKSKTKEKKSSSMKKASSCPNTRKLDKETRKKKKKSDNSVTGSKEKKKKSKRKSTSKTRKSSTYWELNGPWE